VNINSAFPSQFIKASDLEGRAVNVVIREVKVEKVGQSGDQKPVVYFEGKTKGMVLNKTNARKIANLAGSGDTEDWTGITVAIFPTETEFGGETVDCIRVKAAAQSRTARPEPPPPPESVTEDDIPFTWLLPLMLPAMGALLGVGSVLA
jgi:hypothetical protein